MPRVRDQPSTHTGIHIGLHTTRPRPSTDLSRPPAMASADAGASACTGCGSASSGRSGSLSCVPATGTVAATVAVVPPLVHSLTSAVLLGPTLGLCFHPHALHSFARVCRTFSRWVQSSLLAHDRSARHVWQLARRRLVEEREAVVLARGALSEQERADVDEQLHDAWDRFTYPDWHDGGETFTGWWISDRPPLADATAYVGSMRLLVARGARAQPVSRRQRAGGGLQRSADARTVQWKSTCDCYHKLLLVDLMQRPQWSEEEADRAALVLTALRLMWTSNPHLLGDSFYLSGGVFIGLLRLLFLPVVQRYTEDSHWELTVQSQQQADVLFSLCSLVTLLCHIHEADDRLLPDGDESRGEHEGTFVSLLYGSATPCLIPHHDWDQHFDVDDCAELVKQESNYAPISELHRHQQQSLTRLVLNHYGTAQHGLCMDAYERLTPVQRTIRRQAERCLLPCLVHHLDQHVRPDLTRLWLPHLQ